MKFLDQKQFDSAIHYFHRSIRESNPKKDIELRAASLNAIGTAFSSTGLTDSSIYYYEDALDIYNRLENSQNVVILETNLSIIYKNRGLYEKSLEYAFNALPKLEKLEPDRTLASCYNTIGLTYSIIEEYDKALLFHSKALAVRRQIGYDKGVGQSYNNIGDTYIKMKLYDSALNNLYKALDIKQRLDEKPSVTLNNIGEVLMKVGRMDEARNYFVLSLELRDALNDRSGKSVVLNNLGRIEITKGNYSAAEKYFVQSQNLAKETGSLNELKVSLEQMVSVYQALGDYRKALISSNQLLIVKDSLLNKEKTESLLGLQIKFETEQKDQQIELLSKEKDLQNAQLETRRTWVKWLAISSVLLVIVIALVFNQYRISQKNKQGVELLLKELHHRVKNNLQILSSLFMLQSKQLKDETAIQAVKSSEGRVNAMALIHKKLYNKEQSREINIKEYIDELIQYLIHTYGYVNREFSLNLDIEEIQIDVDKAIPVGLILNELVSNAFKYAFASNSNPTLKLNLAVNQNHEIEIEIRDNGSGVQVNVNEEPIKTFGFRMVKTLLKDLKGKMELSSQNGTTILLNIPMSKS